MTQEFDIISIGAVLVDMVSLVDDFPEKDGEVFVNKFKMLPGGAAANVAVLASRLRLKSAFIGKIGKDHFGEYLTEDLQAEGVFIDSMVIKSDKYATGSCYVCVNNAGDRIIYAYSGAADTLTLEELPIEEISAAKWVHLSDLRNIGAIEALLESDLDLQFSLSPGALIAQNPSRAYRLVEKASLVVGSQKEITKIFRCDEEEISAVTQTLRENNSAFILVITKGSKGADIFTSQGDFSIPAFDVPVVDTTGAGDAFAAGMLYGLVKGNSPKQSATIGAACASICIQEVGARSGPKNRREVRKFLRKHT
ncbi:MAG: carbohydrate kinase family protein [Asgard group archaeon]|nr:carbohydrate kinase family protein [Asgard group archaeon]